MINSTLGLLARSIGWLSAFICGLTAVILFVSVAANSIARYVFGHVLQWAPETAQYSMIYGVVFGMLWAYSAGQHPNLGVLPKKNRIVALVVDICAGLFGISLAVSAWSYTFEAGGMLANALQIRMGYFYVSLLIGGILLVLLVFARIGMLLAGKPIPGPDLERAS